MPKAFPDRQIRDKMRPFMSSPDVKRLIGANIVREIRKRTADERIDKEGNPFKGYSKAYAKSLFGQVYGKHAGETANLKASGEMLAAMNATPSGNYDIKVSFLDERSAAKAHGHITGAKGRLPVRDFFGLPEDDIAMIVKEVMSDASKSTLELDIERILQERGTSIPFGTQLFIEEKIVKVQTTTITPTLDEFEEL